MRQYLKRLLDTKPQGGEEQPANRYRLAKTFYRNRLALRQGVRSTFLVFLGILSAGFGLEGFLLPNDFIDGGVSGISLLLAGLTDWPLAILLVVINLPFLAIAYRQIDKGFAIKSFLGILGLSVVLILVHFPQVTSDKLLVSTFGGFFLGLGVGLSMRGGAVLDGTEVLAIYISRKTSLTIGDTLLVFNVLIFGLAAYLVRVEVALYAILTLLATGRTVDFIIEGVEEYIGVTIVSSRHEEIRDFIVAEMQRGVTVYTGLRGHGERENLVPTEIIFTVITRLEIARLQHRVEQIDPNAFIAMHSVKDIRGGILKKRQLPGH